MTHDPAGAPTIGSDTGRPAPVVVPVPAGPADPPADAGSPADRAARALLEKLHPDGHWCAELEGDSILNSEYLLMKAILGQHEPPGATPDDIERFGRIAHYMRQTQRADGAWAQYPGAPPDVSATVKAYLALKIFGGDSPADDHMTRARQAVLEMGGAERINTFSNFYLACLGQVSWDACPSIPPELVLLPRWSPFHLTKVAAWTRTMILPLAICSALRPVRELPSSMGCAELFVDPAARGRLNQRPATDDPLAWDRVFLVADRLLKRAQKLGLFAPFRPAALRRAERWIVERLDPATTDGLGAIFPPMVYVQVAFQALGYERSHPLIAEAERQLDRFFVERDDHVRIQPCFSPVWDTGTALYASAEAGLDSGSEPRIARVCEWLLDREVARVGDWIANLRPADRNMKMGPGPESEDRGGAWAFEYRNDWYPDADDTGMVMMALHRATRGPAAPDELRRRADAAIRRAIRWTLAMQNDDGGWAAFDRTRHREWMEHVPFADHNAMQDPSCPDITGRVLEALVRCGVQRDHASVRRAVAYLRSTQRPDGTWDGRWGVNALYGTWQAVGGIVWAGADPDEPMLARTLDWLRRRQNPDGGFGEHADSYLTDTMRGRGPSTASQTAWAVLTMMFLLGESAATDDGVRRAVEYLERTQLDEDAPAEHPADAWTEWAQGSPEADDPVTAWAVGAERGHGAHILDEPAGSWRERWFTGTGFPKVFYLRYHLYRHYFPLMALARFDRLRRGETPDWRHGDG